MGKVRNILHNKGNVIFSVEPTEMVYRAIELMCEKNIGGLLIVEMENWWVFLPKEIMPENLF